jgi:hypothetical protein
MTGLVVEVQRGKFDLPYSAQAVMCTESSLSVKQMFTRSMIV